jgi:ABC-type multidrug transport system fused ATPase/permease subunit
MSPLSIHVACARSPAHSQVIGVTLQWQGLVYTVPVGRRKKRTIKTVLGGVSGHALPGQLLAVMGPTGAGMLWQWLQGATMPASASSSFFAVWWV